MQKKELCDRIPYPNRIVATRARGAHLAATGELVDIKVCDAGRHWHLVYSSARRAG